MKNFRFIFILSLFFFVDLTLAAAAGIERMVSVDGSCNREATTDRGSITVTASVLENDLKSAVKKATLQYDRAIEAVKKLNLENLNLQSSEYSVSEEKDWVKDHYVSKGFRAKLGFKASTSNVQRLGEVTEIAARQDIHEVGDLSTYLSKEKMKKEIDSCLKEAAEDARSKADRLATSLGASLGRVLQMSESNEGYAPPFQPRLRGAVRMDMAGEPAAPSSSAPKIQEGKQEVSAHVLVSFELK